MKLIDGMKEKQVEFIIIGDGNYKPSFSNYDSVHDFGLLYDEKIKSQLLSLHYHSSQRGLGYQWLKVWLTEYLT